MTAKTFFTFYNGTVQSISGTNPTLVEEPEVLGVTEVLIDGKIVEVTATSGVEQWVRKDPEDYPSNDYERQRRRGSVRKA
jgi:hypothetical protein